MSGAGVADLLEGCAVVLGRLSDAYLRGVLPWSVYVDACWDVREVVEVIGGEWSDLVVSRVWGDDVGQLAGEATGLWSVDPCRTVSDRCDLLEGGAE